MTAWICKQSAIGPHEPARGARWGTGLAGLLLIFLVGCAGPDHQATLRSAQSRGHVFADSHQSPVVSPPDVSAVMRRLPDLVQSEATSRGADNTAGPFPPPVQLASFQETGQRRAGPAPQTVADADPAIGGIASPRTSSSVTPAEVLRPLDVIDDPGPEPDPRAAAGLFPIDLPTALRLAGANNLHIALAAERVELALAQAQASRAKWLPSLNAGISYNKHEGRIQSTEGEVIEANRGSLFVGGGLGLGAPLNGGSGGPPRLFVDMAVADLLFEPLAARQMVDAAAADQSAVFNRNIFKAALGYQRLVHARSLATIREDAVTHATRLVDIAGSFARAGEGYPADEQRARAELAHRQGELLEANEAVDDASTALALVLRLDPTTRLLPTNQEVVPIDLIATNQQLESLIGQAIAARPDLESAEMLVTASSTRADQELWRPWLPHLYAGFSGGGFGGNDNSDLKAFSDRSDFDVAAVWQLENFGFGNAARRRSTESQHRQAHLQVEQLRDRIAAEVTTAYHRTHSRRLQIHAALPQITAADRSLELNFTGIRGGVLRPIEPQQAIGALVDARVRYLNALTRYNVAQFELLHAIGLPPNVAESDLAAETEAVPPPVVY